MDSSQIKDLLLKLGYSKIKDFGKEYRMRPIYRDSDNDTVLCVYKDTGKFIDFSRNISGSFYELTRLSLGLSSIDDAKKWLGEGGLKREIKNQSTEDLSQHLIFNKENLNLISDNHEYWASRNIPTEVVKIFKGGLDNGVERGKLRNRYVFPILNSTEDIVGFSARITKDSSSTMKWKHLGKKSKWVYPAFFNKDILVKEKNIILVESIGDMLSLWSGGIKNTLVTFGLDVSEALICFLLRINAQKITVALNNDSSGSGAGNKAAPKLRKELLNYFDSHKVHIAFPCKNDFGEMSEEEIQNWGRKHV